MEDGRQLCHLQGCLDLAWNGLGSLVPQKINMAVALVLILFATDLRNGHIINFLQTRQGHSKPTKRRWYSTILTSLHR